MEGHSHRLGAFKAQCRCWRCWEHRDPTYSACSHIHTILHSRLVADGPIYQDTWQFTSAWLLDHPGAEVIIADEIESFFWLALYIALRFLRNTCLNIATGMFDMFDQYDYWGTEFRCGAPRRQTMESGQLPWVCAQPYEFLDDNGESTHPINIFLGQMLYWLSARYEKLNRPTIGMIAKYSMAGRLHPLTGATVTERDEDARKLDDHSELLQLLDELLKSEWPINDKLGDLIKNPALAYVRDSGMRPLSVRDEEEEEPSQLPQLVVPYPRPMARTRGRRMSRPYGRAIPSTRNLNPRYAMSA